MENSERKLIIAQLLKQGQKLSEIQDYLRKEKNDTITYMELRMLLAEMEAKLPDLPSEHFTPLKQSPLTAKGQQPPARAKGQPSPAPTPGQGATARAKTSVAVDHAPQPGAVLSGRVNFGSGAKAYWIMDEMGRIGLEPELGSGRPDPQDMQEFQNELRRILEQAQGGMA